MTLEQRKHKAMHCGYKKKPTKTKIKALLTLYGETKFTNKNESVQLKLF